MFKLLLVGKKKESFSEFITALKEEGGNVILYADTSETALKLVKENAVDLVITDEDVGDISGLEFARKLIKVSPLTNCVAFSRLSEKDFHEASEGLGLMTHLPLNPDRADAEKLLKNLRQIKGLESGQD